VQTSGPIAFYNLPVGATATVVCERFAAEGVAIAPSLAGLLLSAILTDTMLFKSPTATDLDREWAERLGVLAGVDPTTFGAELFRAKDAATPFSVDDVLRSDLKRFDAGGVAIGIAQRETVDAAPVLEHTAELREGMEALRAREGFDLVLLLVTDITREGSHLLATGDTALASRALGTGPLAGEAVWLPGVLSRKKQVAAPIVDEALRGR
jgi:manganese-dependent inorganic pyrophosphatase